MKPPTRTLPKVVMKEWPSHPLDGLTPFDERALSDFTRVVEETGILDQERPQKDGPPSNEREATKSDRWPAGSADRAGVPLARD